jgi:predicted ArsR family transcriptional regulator
VTADGLLPFEPHKLARASDPETSHQAAVMCEGIRSTDQRRILEILGRARRPMSSEEIAEHHDGLSYHAVARRMAELEREGFVVKTTTKHRNKSGRSAFRYTTHLDAPHHIAAQLDASQLTALPRDAAHRNSTQRNHEGNESS